MRAVQVTHETDSHNIVANVFIRDFENGHYCGRSGNRHFDDCEVVDYEVVEVINDDCEPCDKSIAEPYLDLICEIATNQ